MPTLRARWLILAISCGASIAGLAIVSCSSDDSTADTSGDTDGGETAGSNAGSGGSSNVSTGSGGGAGAGVSATGGNAAGGSATGGNATSGNAGNGGALGSGGAKADAGSGDAKAGSGGGSAGDAGQLVPLGVSGSWHLSFSDEFDGNAIDTAKWRIMDTADPVYWGSQKWRAADSFLDGNGLLVTRLTNTTGSVTGGAIYSKWKLSKGYYEARIKHEGGWFAWWIESPENGNGGANEDPAIYGTEMDICEADAWTANVLDKQHAVHWHGYGQYHQTVSASTGIHDNQWHVYGFKWSDAAYDFYVDGAPTYHFTTAISQTLDEDMIINNASYQGNQTSGLAYVDYVRYWTAQ